MEQTRIGKPNNALAAGIADALVLRAIKYGDCGMGSLAFLFCPELIVQGVKCINQYKPVSHP